MTSETHSYGADELTAMRRSLTNYQGGRYLGSNGVSKNEPAFGSVFGILLFHLQHE